MKNYSQGVTVQYIDTPRFECPFSYSLISNPAYLSLLIINMGLISVAGHKALLNIKYINSYKIFGLKMGIY